MYKIKIKNIKNIIYTLRINGIKDNNKILKLYLFYNEVEKYKENKK
jgi:hypothetical protein